MEAYCAGIRAFDLLDQYYFYCETPVIAFPYTQNIYHRECLKDLTGFLSSIEQEKPALRDFCLDNNIPPEELKTAFISALYKRFPDSLINKADYTKQLYLAETFNTAIDRYICFLHTGENRKRLRPEVAAALNRALTMPLAERISRHAEMLEVIVKNDINHWQEQFICDLKTITPRSAETLQQRKVATFPKLA